MIKKPKKKIWVTEHSTPVTRREFLSQGAIGFSALAGIPMGFGFLTKHAWSKSDDPCGGGQTGFIPFMVFDMAGGAALPANFLVGGAGGANDLLPSYDRLGWNPRGENALNTEFGLPMYTGSGVLQGILSATSAETRQNLRMGSICHIAQIDTNTNKLSALSLVSRAGSQGLYVQKGVGSTNSNSGGNSDQALTDATLHPVFVTSVTDIQGAINFGGTSLGDLTRAQKETLVDTSFNLSREIWQSLGDRSNGPQLATLADCAYRRSYSLLDNVSGIDPRQDDIFQQIYGIDANSAGNDATVVAATLALNVLRGYSGPGAWTLGDCDYHNGTRTKGDGRDNEMGVQIGRALEAARLLNRPFFFQLITDGGCEAAGPGSPLWVSDAEDKCVSVIGYYNPTAVPQYRNNRMQVGQFLPGQGVDRTTLVGGDPRRAAYAAFANYLNVMGRISEFDRILPGVFTAAELESLLVFQEV